jgi:hypothetical protein
LAAVDVPPTGETEFPEIEAQLSKAAGGLTDVCVVARFDEGNGGGQILGLNWIEFVR